MASILVINGPNLNLLGNREQALYGEITLDAINSELEKQASTYGHTISCHQSNAEHELIEKLHQATTEFELIIINPAAFTHTSIALRDALLATNIPYIEVHLSNIYGREPFRAHSYFSDKAIGVIAGFGHLSYQLALNAANHYLQNLETTPHGYS